MRAIVQRVTQGRVRVAGASVAEIGRGYVVLLGISTSDGPGEADVLAEKVAYLRIINDEAGKMNRSILDAGGDILSVSQFTLYGDTARGRRPSFIHAAEPAQAEALYARFNERLRTLGIPVQTGTFRAMMSVEIYNDGPVTIVLDTDAEPGSRKRGIQGSRKDDEHP
ncbi:MAG: D-aminoacyl-tRNA deacylase [bacterium]